MRHGRSWSKNSYSTTPGEFLRAGVKSGWTCAKVLGAPLGWWHGPGSLFHQSLPGCLFGEKDGAEDLVVAC